MAQRPCQPSWCHGQPWQGDKPAPPFASFPQAVERISIDFFSFLGGVSTPLLPHPGRFMTKRTPSRESSGQDRDRKTIGHLLIFVAVKYTKHYYHVIITTCHDICTLLTILGVGNFQLSLEHFRVDFQCCCLYLNFPVFNTVQTDIESVLLTRFQKIQKIARPISGKCLPELLCRNVRTLDSPF